MLCLHPYLTRGKYKTDLLYLNAYNMNHEDCANYNVHHMSIIVLRQGILLIGIFGIILL